MVDRSKFKAVDPWPLPEKERCVFYHTMSLPGGEEIKAAWDIRQHFDSYIGNYPIKGKTLLDIGTASGFLTFSAEKAGATVTSVDAYTGYEINHIPHLSHTYHLDRQQFVNAQDSYFTLLRNGYWYAWHKLESKAEVVYAPLAELPFWGKKFDVVLAGAILEHLSDPVTTIGNLCGLAKEAVIIAHTGVLDTDDLIMKGSDNWKKSSPDSAYTWWTLSRGLYRQIFDNLGFDVEFKDAYAVATFAGETEPHLRPTIVARRRDRT